MVVLVTCKFDDNTNKNEGAIVFTRFFSIISPWEKFLLLKGK